MIESGASLAACVALFTDIEFEMTSSEVVVVNFYSHSECMQHVSRTRVRTGKQPKKNIK